MNTKFLSIFVLAILVVGLSTVSAVSATVSGVSQSVPKDKIMPLVVSEGIKIVKVVERSNNHISTSSKKKIRQLIRRDHSLPTIRVIPFVPKEILPKPIIVTPSAS